MNKQFDSTPDTLLHIKRVNELLILASKELLTRGVVHDASKLESYEKEGFDTVTSQLKDSTYGSPEYQSFLKQLAPILAHHYKLNSHHPEHYVKGVDGMNLFDIIEMFFDWKASSERHTTGDIYESIFINKKRFEMSDQLCNIFANTCKYLNYKK
jgi:hypothetical protein